MDVFTPSHAYIQDHISKTHCQKCGRRSRGHREYINKRRGTSEQRRCQHSKCKRQRLFPTDSSPRRIITATNDNHSVSKDVPSRKNVIIDQLIQVKQLDVRQRRARSDSYTMRNDDPIITETFNSNAFHRVQQMVYLRENINNLTYREVHFSKEFIILKRLEEKNHFIHQTRLNVDHYSRSLKLQYQTMSLLLQNVTITTFPYSKQEPIRQTPQKQYSPLTNDLKNYPILSEEESPSPMLEIIDTSTNGSLSRTDSLMLLTPSNTNKPLQYSQNANQCTVKTEHSQQIKTQNLVFDTAVMIDVRKMNFIHQPEAMFQSWSHNFNGTHQNQILTDSPFTSLIHHQPCSTDGSIHPSSESDKTTSNPTHTEQRQSIQVITQIKQILNRLKNRLLSESIDTNTNLNISCPSTHIAFPYLNRISHQIDRSISATMTSDSLLSNTSFQTTSYTEKKFFQFEFDSLDEYRTAANFRMRNTAKNVNTNQKESDDDDDVEHTRYRKTMSSSFMFILQILLVTCLLNRLLMSYMFGIVPMDSLTSIILDHSPTVTSTSSTHNSHTEQTDLFDYFLSVLF